LKGSLSTLGLALVAVLALGAFASASASATTQHWYGYAGGTRLAEKTPTEVLAKGEGATRITYHYSGVTLAIRCGSMSSGGTIENPSGGADGKLNGVVITFGECVVEEPANKCVVPSTIETVKLKGEATKYDGSPAIKYQPESGQVLTTFWVTNCALSGSKNLTGSFTAQYRGSEAYAPGFYQVTGLSSEDLKWEGFPVVMVSAYQLKSISEKPVALVAEPLSGALHWYLGGAPAEGTKTKFAEGTAFSYSAVPGSMTFTISSLIGGVNFKLQCAGSVNGAEGSLENPTGGGAGTAAGTLTFGNCSVVEPAAAVKTCSVEAGGATPVVSAPLSGLATEAEGAPAVRFSPAEKTNIATFVLKGCTPVVLNGSKALTGSLTGSPDPFGTYVFSPTVNQSPAVKYSGVSTTVSGQVTLETGTGERIVLAP
jgi:hypothetical protein